MEIRWRRRRYGCCWTDGGHWAAIAPAGRVLPFSFAITTSSELYRHLAARTSTYCITLISYVFEMEILQVQNSMIHELVEPYLPPLVQPPGRSCKVNIETRKIGKLFVRDVNKQRRIFPFIPPTNATIPQSQFLPSPKFPMSPMPLSLLTVPYAPHPETRAAYRLPKLHSQSHPSVALVRHGPRHCRVGNQDRQGGFCVRM